MDAAQAAHEARQLSQIEATAAAKLAWHAMNDKQKNILRFGMIPAEIADEYLPLVYAAVPRERARLFAVALMDCAKRDGGMAV